MSGGAEFHIGRTVEVTNAEARTLRDLADYAARLTRSQHKGWLKDYVRVLTEQNKIIRRVVERSHANGGPGHGSNLT